MSRELSVELAAEVSAPVLRPVLLVDCEFDAGEINLWSGLGVLTAFSKTYNGGGTLLSISEYQETQRLEAQGLTITLSGISSSILEVAMDEPYQGRPCRVFIGALNPAGQLVSDPYQLFSGFMDVMNLELGGDTCTVAINVEHKLIILDQSKERRYTSEDQKAEYPGDLGFDFVTSLQDKDIVWGVSN